jgi:cation transport ATPase
MNSIDIVVALIVVFTALAVAVLVWFFATLNRRESYVGTVTDVIEVFVTGSAYSHMRRKINQFEIRAYIETDRGKFKIVKVFKSEASERFKQVKKGDRIEKRAGEAFPRILG